MIELAAVLTTGGLLLFSTTFPIDLSILNSIVNLVNDSKNLQANFLIDTLRINYLYDALLGLIYIIAWRKEISLEFPDKLLRAMSLEWKNIYNQLTWKDDLLVDCPKFDSCWANAFENWKKYLLKKDQDKGKMATFQSKKGSKVKKDPKQDDKSEKSESEEIKSPRGSQSNEEVELDPEWERLTPKERIMKMKEKKKSSKSPKQKQKEEIDTPKSNIRQWEGGKIDKKTVDKLYDRSKKIPQSQIQSQNKKYFEESETTVSGFLDSDDEEEIDEKSNSFLNKWVGKFKNIVGDKVITRQDLNEVLQDFKQKLMTQNVAQQVAGQIAQAVGQTLIQTKTKSFTSVQKTVKVAMKEALRKILTPKRKIDLVVEVTKERQNLKPYVIVFVGVNGVGKSTNLAKVAYKLKNANLSVMLAACDNFRAGAVEQIQTHGRNLGIPVFSKGYKQEPANIAYEAIKDATKKRIDAVLVDTAGRMQDNAPLMKELARLVKLNKPNLAVFIGQALAGNDAVDQITKFNKALVDESTQNFKPQIDAILLSKFDTVDDKVGAALSLVYSTSKPILYVGVGQKYPNLRELNVSTVVNSLLA